MAIDNRNGTASPAPATLRRPSADEQAHTGCWTFSLLPPLKPGDRQKERQTVLLALYHLGDSAKYGIFLADTNGGQTPTHLGIGSQVTGEILQHFADKHGFVLHQLTAFRDAPRQAVGDADARGAA